MRKKIVGLIIVILFLLGFVLSAWGRTGQAGQFDPAGQYTSDCSGGSSGGGCPPGCG